MRMLQRLQQATTDYEPWTNESTAFVDSLLMAEEVKPIIRRLVYAWNDGEGLGVELADELEGLVRSRFEEATSPGVSNRRLRKVNWNQLAEQYALSFCGVTEIELSRRRADRLT